MMNDELRSTATNLKMHFSFMVFGFNFTPDLALNKKNEN